jgi:hypothetical protein
LTGTSQTRIAILIGCSVLAGAILMTAGARFLLLAALVLLVTPKVAEILHRISAVDEAQVRNALSVVALLAGGLGALLATLTVIQRAVLVAIAALVAVLVYAGPTPGLLGSLPSWSWIESTIQFLHAL